MTLSDKDSSQGISSRAAMGGASIHYTPSATNTTLGESSSMGTTASAGPSHSVIGDMLCLISAIFYASYTIVLRRSLPDDDEANVALFFGYVGLLCSVVFAPVVAVMAGLGAMHLKTIPPKAYLIILIEGRSADKLLALQPLTHLSVCADKDWCQCMPITKAMPG